eukprot:5031324-Prymnesium_polylepis.1
MPCGGLGCLCARTCTKKIGVPDHSCRHGSTARHPEGLGAFGRVGRFLSSRLRLPTASFYMGPDR